ncbi:MAG: primosome assembly protein PriA [Planctomycetes bacterium ADurb.Bin401]|nr:MAG: primosome assembly protein PriA [Planctomycetes bacterium ADurb.Bin401]
MCLLPPFGRLAIIRIRDTKFDRLTSAAQKIAEQISGIISSCKFNIKMNGPADAAIARIQRYHRKQIILQTRNPVQLSELLSRFRKLKPPSSLVQIQVDVDPVNLL